MRARPEEMRCVGSKRTRELGRDMLLAASIVKFFLGTRRPMGEIALRQKKNFLFLVEIFLER